MRVLLLLIICILLGSTAQAFALSGDWENKEFSRARIISSVNNIGDTDNFLIGIQIDMPKGWKTYWRTPGDAALPPAFNWDASKNIKDTKVFWPVPKRFSVAGFDNFGYVEKIIYPIQINVSEKKRPVTLDLKLNLLLCKEICVPGEHQLSLSLPTGNGEVDLASTDLIQNYKKKEPIKTSNIIQSVSIEKTKDLSFISLIAKPPFTPQNVDVFIENSQSLSFGAPGWTYRDIEKTLRLHIPLNSILMPHENLKDLLSTEPLTITLKDDDQAYEEMVTIKPSIIKSVTSPILQPSMIIMIGFALLGGLILNLMPCVLPVLSLKVLSLVSHGKAPPWKIRQGFLASAAGIVLSFLLMALILIGLKQAGIAIGWGIQFQNPVFLTVLIILLTLFASNLWGLFEIPLPRFIAKTLPKTHEHEPTLLGHFATGALATLLATPCTAPFLGTAIGFAFSKGTMEILIIFTALGIGLSLPYLIVALFPALASILPKPGHWMLTMKKILAMALGLTALWLLFVLNTIGGVLLTGLMAGLMVLLIAFFKYSGKKPNVLRLSCIGLALALPLIIIPPERSSSLPTNTFWKPFSKGLISKGLNDNKIIFIDVTADWCLTCKANKKLVLENSEIEPLLKQDNIIAMRADWTRPNSEIANYLKSFKRYGIPFNVVYGPNAPEGIPLPELLSIQSIKDALGQAK